MKKIVLIFLKTYKKFLSPFIHRFFGLQGMVCRHSPTCSEYSLQMIDRHGVLKGVFLGVKRLLSCHPYSFKIAKLKFKNYNLKINKLQLMINNK